MTPARVTAFLSSASSGCCYHHADIRSVVSEVRGLPFSYADAASFATARRSWAASTGAWTERSSGLYAFVHANAAYQLRGGSQ
jgi:hypothetical protein